MCLTELIHIGIDIAHSMMHNMLVICDQTLVIKKIIT